MVNLDKIEQSKLWYVIGFIASDGNLSKDGRHINITSKDRKHLFLIRNALLLKSKIGRKTRERGREKIYSQLQFSDVSFYKYLITLGFTSNKSLTIAEIKINNDFFIDFLRGVIDGDGNISTWIHRTNLNRQWCLRIYSASSIFINWLENEIEEYFKVKGKLYARKEKNKEHFVYILKFGKKSATKILKNIYYSECLALERKYLKAQLCLQQSTKVLN